MSLTVPSMAELEVVFEQIRAYSPSNLINFVPPLELEVQLEEMLLHPKPSVQDLSARVGFALHHSVNTSHPHFVNQFYGGVNPVGLAAAFLIEKMNTNQ